MEINCSSFTSMFKILINLSTCVCSQFFILSLLRNFIEITYSKALSMFKEVWQRLSMVVDFKSNKC